MENKAPLKTVAIYLRGYALDPEHISKALAIQPSRAQKKGGTKPGSTRYIAKIGMWTLKIKSESRSVSDLVAELFEQVGKQQTRLDRLSGVEDAHLDILLAFGENSREAAQFELTKAQVSKASELGLSICVTVM